MKSKFTKFSHKTPHLNKKQHQLDPNLDLKQSVYHATTQYVDWDNDGDVDEYDKKPKIVSNKIEEQSEERRYCPMCKKKERRMECSYGPAMWDAVTVGKKVSESKKAEPDHEYSMARSELSTIERAVKRLKSKMKGEGNIEAWVQSKITKAADYIDAAADYLDSGEHNVHDSMDEEKNTCWKGYKRKKGTKKYSPGSCVKEEYIEEKNSPTNPKLWAKWKSKAKAKFDVYPSAYANGWAAKGYKSEGGGWKSVEEQTIEDLNGNTFLEIVDVIKSDPIKKIKESIRIPSKTGNIILVTLNWRGKYYAMKMFFPQVSIPTRKDVQDQIDKVYPGSRVLAYNISDIKPGEQFLQVSEAIDKDKMKCNDPKSDPVGDSKTGKSHVVKACEDGEEEIIRFGQKGVKGSPAKEGESEESKNRRNDFKDRHRKNIAKGVMSAAYWSNKVKW